MALSHRVCSSCLVCNIVKHWCLAWSQFVKPNNSAVMVLTCVFQTLPTVFGDLEQLREFWDPDTVELMEWIQFGFFVYRFFFRQLGDDN